MRLKALVRVAMIDEVVARDRLLARGPQPARSSFGGVSAEVGEASRCLVDHIAMDGSGIGMQRPALHRWSEDEQDYGVAGVVCVHGMRCGSSGRDPRGAELAIALSYADEAVSDEDGVGAAEREITDVAQGAAD